MQTRNCVIILLIAALTGSTVTAMQAGQDNSARPQQTAQRKLSGTRSASCLVRITADPVIVPLDPATVQGLLYSSGVAAQAVREVFQGDFMESPWEELIQMEWLDKSSPRPSSAAASLSGETAAYDKQMMQELENIYGAEYMRQMGIRDLKSRDKPDQPTGGSADSTSRYGIRPKRNPPDTLPPSQSGLAAAPSATIRLSVHLPGDVPPTADEFLRAVIGNLRSSLRHAHEVYISDISDQLTMTEGQYNAAVDALQGGTNPETSAIKERLDRVVDLSALKSEMPLSEAIEILKRSVEPPLNIVVLWNDLMAFLSVERTTPINIDGMPSVKLGTALDLLVRGLPASTEQPLWKIKGDVIVIATAAALGESSESMGQPKIELDVQALAVQRNGLTNKLQDLELSLAGQEARRRAIAEQIMQMERETQEKLAQDQVTRELENLVQLSAENLANLRKQADAGRASGTDLAQATENLTRARIELAKRREELSKQAGGGQLEQLNGELGRMAIDRAEKEAQKGILSERLAQMQQQVARVSMFDPEAAQMRMVREGLDILSRRIAELRARIANLQPPMVTVIGAN